MTQHAQGLLYYKGCRHQPGPPVLTLGRHAEVPILAKGDFAKGSFAEPQFPVVQNKQNTLLQAASKKESLAVGGKGLPYLLVLRPPAFKEKGQLVLAVRGLLSPHHVLRKGTSLFSAP